MKDLLKANNISPASLEDNMTLLTAEEVASILMVGKNRVYELLNQKKIKGMKIGSTNWRIPKLAVYQYIQEQANL